MPGTLRVSICALLLVLLAAGIAAALVSSKDDGFERVARTADAILLAGGVIAFANACGGLV